MGDSMNRKIIGILLSITLLLTVLPVSGIIEYDGYQWKNILNKKNTPSPVFKDIKNSYGMLGRNNSPPNAPNNPFPDNGSINVAIDSNLNWTGGDPDGNNVTYNVYFGTTSPPTMISNNQTDSTYDPGIMDYNTIHYWQVIAWDNQSEYNASPIWEFTTIQEPNLPPYQPSNPDPTDGEVDINILADLSWSGGDPNTNDTVTYDVYFGTNTTPSIVSNNQSALAYDPGIMYYNTTYYWQIIAWDNLGENNVSSLWNFTTAQEQNLPPYKPSDPNPANGEIDVSLSADLSWTGGDPNGNETVTYDVYFGTNMTPSLVSDNQNDTVYDPGNFQENTTYYWNIIAFDDQNLSNASDMWNFTTGFNQPPNQPSSPSPINGATDIGIFVDISWLCTDPDNDALTYDVYFGNITPPPKIASNISDATYDLDTLENNMTYYWQIVAWDEFGAYNTSIIWHFTTYENEAPFPPKKITGPKVGGPLIDLNFTAITSDPEGDDLFYKFEWGDGNESDWLGPFDITSPVKANYSWNNSGEYKIRIKAKDIHDNEGAWSEEYNMSIFRQIQMNNLKPGFVYFHLFTFTGSYLFLQMFQFLGICGIISTGKVLIVNATVSEHVDSVKFESLQILWNLTTEEVDNDMSDECAVILTLAAGLYQISATAYDEDGNKIDVDKVPYLFYFCRSKSGGGQVKRALLDRL